MIELIILLVALVPVTIVGTAAWLYWRSRKKSKVTGTPTPTSTTLPRGWKTWVKLAMLVGFWVFWIWFLPDTVPGKALLKATGFSAQNEWYPWVMQYIPTAILVWVGWRIFSASATATSTTGAKSGGGLTKLAVWVIIAAGTWVSLDAINTKKDSQSVGDMEPVFSLSRTDKVRTKLVDIEGQMEVVYSEGSHCGIIVGPLIMLNHPDRPQADNFLLKSQGAGGWWYYTFSEDFKRFYKEKNMREPIKVEFRYGPNGSPPTC